MNLIKALFDLFKSNGTIKKKIPYSKIAKNMIDHLNGNIDEIGRKLLMPDSFNLYFSPEDRKSRIKVENIVINELKEELYRYAKGLNSLILKESIKVNILTDTALMQGTFKIDCFYSTQYGQENFEPPINQTFIDDGFSGEYFKALPPYSKEQNFQDSFIEEVMTIINKRYTLYMEGKEGMEKIELENGSYLIGRGKNTDIKIKNADLLISRRHLQLDISDDGIFGSSLGRNGTFLNGEIMKRMQRVHFFPGNILKIGSYKLKLIDNMIN